MGGSEFGQPPHRRGPKNIECLGYPKRSAPKRICGSAYP